MNRSKVNETVDESSSRRDCPGGRFVRFVDSLLVGLAGALDVHGYSSQ